MSLGVRLVERVKNIYHAMQVRAATRRDQRASTPRGCIHHPVPAPERLEDRLLLSGTIYVELNPFGDAALDNTLASITGADIFAFALDTNGDTQLDVDDLGGALNAGLVLWDLHEDELPSPVYSEDNVALAVNLDTNGDDPQIIDSLDKWNLYAAEVFAQTSFYGDFTLTIDGPIPFTTPVSLDADGDASHSSDLSVFFPPGDAQRRSGNDADYFSFVAPITGNGDLTLTLTPDHSDRMSSTLNGVLTLYDSTGAQLARANSGGIGIAETIDYTGAVAGETYYARVGSSAYALNAAASYDLDLDFDLFDLPLPTTWSNRVEGFATMHRDGFSHDVLSFDAKISYAGDIDSYYFASDTTGTVTIDVDDFGNDVDPLVAIYNASTGAMLGWDDDSGSDDNARVSVDISNNTRYIVAVADANGLATGDLGITIDTPMDKSASNIVIGIDGAGTSPVPNIQAADSDFLKFTTPANTIGTGSVTVTPVSTLDVEFVMFDAAGNELDRGTSSSTGNPSSFSYSSFAPNAEYYLTIHSDDYDTTGDVTLVEVDLDLYGEIHGTKFYDRDQDGIHDPGEESLPGWTIYLDENNNGVPDQGEPITVTDENGEYAFTNLLEGTHVVREILKAGWTQTAPDPASTLLYNVDFDTPPHTVDAAPAIGAGPATRETISSINMGMPTVVAASGIFDQSLLFATSTTGYGQVQFDLDDFGQTFDHYSIQMDLLVQTLDAGDSFNVLLDTPSVRKVLFRPDGTIESRAGSTFGTQIGSYVKGAVLDLHIDVDLVAAIWTITLDGAVLHSGGFNETNVDQLRLSLHDLGTTTSSVAVDNIIIRGRDFGFTVPNALANTDGEADNYYPFHSISEELRYQQIYDASQFASGGMIDEIRFRPDALLGSAFNAIGMDLQINLGYAATTVASASATFANNIGSGYVTVHDGLLNLSSNHFGSPSAFDVILDVDDLFLYDPTRGDLLLDVLNRSPVNAGFSPLDYSRAPENVVTNRIYSNDPNAVSGQVSTTIAGLVTHFVFTDDGHAITLGSGEVATADFGNYAPPGEIHGTKFNDNNGNGLRERGELGLAEWTIYLDLDRDGTLDAGEPFDTTDNYGNYSFTDLVPGSYTVAEIQQNDFSQTAPNTGPYGIAGPSGGVVTESGAWAWDGANLVEFRNALEDAGNFGAGGIFNRDIVTTNMSIPNAAALSTVDGFVSPWWSATDSATFHTDIEEFFLAGGDLMLFNDADNRDGVATTLGIPTFSSSDPIVYIDQERYVHSWANPYGSETVSETISASGFESFNADLLVSAYVEDEFYYIEGSASQESSLNPASIVAMGAATSEEGPPMGSSWGQGETYMDVTFRVNETVGYTLDASFVNSSYGEFDIYGPSLMISEEFESSSEYDITTSGTLEPGDYTVHIHLPADALDIDEVSFEFELVFIPGPNLSPVNGWAPCFDGIFGTAHDVQQSQDGQLDPLHVAATGGTIVALNASGQAAAAYWGPGTYAPGSGALLITTDVDMISTQADYAPLNDNGIFSLNAVSTIVDIHGTQTVSVTPATPTINSVDFGNHDVQPPQVTEMLVRGSKWDQAFLDHLQDMSLGHGGYSIPVGSLAQADPLPFANIDEVMIRFSEPVSIDLTDVRLVGVLGPDGVDDAADDYGLVNLTTVIGVTGDFEAVIELDAPIATDKLLLTVFDSTLDTSLNHLDGEWRNGMSVYPSGNGDEYRDFSFRFNVLPGDITQNGTVEGGDLSMLLGGWLQSVPPVHPLTDITGNTLIGGGDLSVVLGNWLTNLPAGTPSNSPSGNTAMALLTTAEGSLGRFGLGSVGQGRGDRSGPAMLVQEDDDNVDPLTTTGGRIVMVDTARSLAI